MQHIKKQKMILKVNPKNIILFGVASPIVYQLPILPYTNKNKTIFVIGNQIAQNTHNSDINENSLFISRMLSKQRVKIAPSINVTSIHDNNVIKVC